MTYNDASVLENYHAALTFQLLLSPGTDVLRGLSPHSFTQVRNAVITNILGTDMKTHAEQLQTRPPLLDRRTPTIKSHTHFIFRKKMRKNKCYIFWEILQQN